MSQNGKKIDIFRPIWLPLLDIQDSTFHEMIFIHTKKKSTTTHTHTQYRYYVMGTIKRMNRIKYLNK